jgi:hypothetical protein
VLHTPAALSVIPSSVAVVSQADPGRMPDVRGSPNPIERPRPSTLSSCRSKLGSQTRSVAFDLGDEDSAVSAPTSRHHVRGSFGRKMWSLAVQSEPDLEGAIGRCPTPAQDRDHGHDHRADAGPGHRCRHPTIQAVAHRSPRAAALTRLDPYRPHDQPMAVFPIAKSPVAGDQGDRLHGRPPNDLPHRHLEDGIGV